MCENRLVTASQGGRITKMNIDSSNELLKVTQNNLVILIVCEELLQTRTLNKNLYLI